MLKVKMMTGSNVVRHGKVNDLDKEDTQRIPGVIVLRMTWKVQACSKKKVQFRNK